MKCCAAACCPHGPACGPGAQSSLSGHSEGMVRFGGRSVDPAMVRLVSGLSLVLLLSLVGLLISFPAVIAELVGGRQQPQVQVGVDSTQDLLAHLRANKLWDIDPAAEVPAFLVDSLPADFPRLDAATQKRVFLHTLLPVAMVAVAEVEDERERLELILSRLPNLPRRLNVTEARTGGGALAGLAGEDLDFLEHLGEKYRTREVAKLRQRVNPVPVSLILAQAAMESYWGSSRSALEANNLFGIRTWGGKGLMPTHRRPGLTHRIATYDSLLDAVRSYILILNRVPVYQPLWRIREGSMDSISLAGGLVNYSERGEDYVADLARFIRSNRLQRYDRCVLANRQPGFHGGVRMAALQ